MPREYRDRVIRDDEIPVASLPWMQHALDTYASETNKVASVWRLFADADLPYKPHLAGQTSEWWLTRAPFFDVERQRIWIFWRRVLHTAHHRTQLTVYLRLLGRRVPATYGPTADESWDGADPTTSVQAAARKS